jgi:AraC-like DNA-binding protein
MISFELRSTPNIILLGKRICDVNYGYSSHRIQNYELVFVYGGELYITLDDESFIATAGDCVLLKPGQIFSAKIGSGDLTKYYIVHWNLTSPVWQLSDKAALSQIEQSIQSYNYQDLNDIFEMPHTSYKRIYLSERCSIKNYPRIYDILENMIAERNQLKLCSEIMISVRLCEILIILSRATFGRLGVNVFLSEESELPNLVQEAIFFINNNYMNHVCIDDLCGILGVSPQYLIRIFKKHLHITPLQYVNHFRIQKAKTFLRHTSMYIKEISYDVGIQNPYYFCRLFKQVENMTPTEYRNCGE